MQNVTIEEVIAAGQTISEPSIHMEWFLNLKGIIFILVVMSLVIFYFYRQTSYPIKKCIKKSMVAAIIAYVVWGTGQGIYTYSQAFDDFQQHVSMWKQKIVSPYIDQLAWTSKDVLTIDPDPSVRKAAFLDDISTITQSDRLNEWTEDDHNTMKIIAITYADGPLTKQYDYFEIKRDLKPKEKMILKTKIVPKDLGFDLIKGNYKSVLHVPADFKIE